ncbi:TGACG-sequence-specific DNA-binding protein TGA-2.1 [Sarracenia purpurea var. burkii]
MESVQQSLAETLANDPPHPSGSPGNVANYMGQMAMAMAMGKLGALDARTVLTIRQSACALLAINDYFSRFRALSSLWLARLKE